MKRIILFLFVIPILFACTTNNKESSEKDKVNGEEKAVVTEMAVDTTTSSEKQPRLKMTLNKDKKAINLPSGENSIPDLQSKTGEKSAERGTIDDEEEALRLRRARTQFNNGITYYKDGNLTDAIDAFKKSLELKPDNDKAFYNLGKIYYELGQKELSFSYYKDAVNLNPKDSLSMLGVGLIYYEKGSYQEALDYYSRTIEIAPTFAMAYFNRGTMLGQNKQYNQALDDLNNAIKYDPEYSESYINRGLAYFYMQEMEKACNDWQKAKQMGNKKGEDAVRIYCSGSKK